MKLPILIGLLSFSLLTQAQDVQYLPSKSKVPSKKKLEDRLANNLAIDILSIDENRKNRKEIEAIYTDRSNSIFQMATDADEYIFETSINTYLDRVFNKLITANNIDASRAQLFYSRDLSPNASCFGEGTIVINTGLLRRIKSEDELAFILSHELAHYLDNHVNDRIIEYVSNKNDRKTQKEIKRISKLKYNRNKSGVKLLKSFIYDSSKHSRLHESDADEKAIEIMDKAGYSSASALTALKLLKDVDEEKYEEEIIIHREFNRELYPFKPSWKEEKNALAAFFDKDSQNEILEIDEKLASTHPDIEKRVKNLQGKVSGEVGKPSKAHKDAVQQADFDYVLNAYHYDNYGYAIYQSLQLQKKYGHHPFLTGIIGACMGEMAIAIDKHELGKILPASSPEYNENYNQLLKFLNNLDYKDMMEVGYNYVKIYSGQAGESEALAYALALTSKLKNEQADKKKYLSIYRKAFPNGYFKRQVNKL